MEEIRPDQLRMDIAYISPDNLIPPDSELGILLTKLSEDADNGIWQIANICNELIEELEGGKVSNKDVYRAVAARCKGRKVNTIRRWAECARDFDKDTQEFYKPLLSFEHFKMSRRLFHEDLTPNLTYGLEWCVEGNDDKLTAGKFHTVGEMLNHFIPDYRLPRKPVWGRFKESLYDELLLIDNDTDRERALDAWKTIEYVFDKNKVFE